MSTEQQEIVTPDQFMNQFTGSAPPVVPEPEEKADEDNGATDEEKEIADKESVIGDQPSEEEGEETKEDTEEKEASKEEEQEKLYDVTVDGEKLQVNEEDLKKSYERYKASTQRFMEAAEIKKEAEKSKAESDQKVKQAENAFRNLLTHPQAILDIIGGNAPETLHRAFELYAGQHMRDQELREKDPALYESTLAQRQQEAILRRQRQEIEQEKRSVEETKKLNQQQEEERSNRKTLDIYNATVPKALVAAGVPKDMCESIMIKGALSNIVKASWPNDLLLDDLPKFVEECAKELVKDPAVKKMIGEQAPKEAPKKPQQKKVTVTAPTETNGEKTTFISPNDFVRDLNKKRYG